MREDTRDMREEMREETADEDAGQGKRTTRAQEKGGGKEEGEEGQG